mmetsp:Transcript_34635/g.81775  ORF Transcript_34635/g.81775 Transcript_34635/m.81775 type:complete len:360 (-) Transcript_34635:14-1093(-)
MKNSTISSEVGVERERVVDDLVLLGVHARHDAGLLVLAHAPLEEVGLALQRDELHPIERVGAVVQLGRVERHEQPVGAELDVLGHHPRVHADQVHRERLADELLLVQHGVADDVVQLGVGQLVLEHAVQQAREVAVHALVARDQLVREGEPRHEAALLEPEDRAERAREEDALHRRERHQPLREARRLRDPLQRPVGLLPHARHGLQRVEQPLLLDRVLDVRVDQQAVRLGVDVLHRDLEAVEAARLGELHLRREALAEVLVDDAVRCGEEREHVRDEELLVRRQLLPVGRVVRKVDLLRGPEAGLGLLVHLPHPRVLDREEHEPLLVDLQDGLVGVERVRLVVEGHVGWWQCGLRLGR